MNKNEIRKKYLTIRENIKDDEKKAANRAICDTLSKHDVLNSSTVIGAYISDGNEPDLNSYLQYALKCGKEVLLPRFNQSSKCYEMVAVPAVDDSVLECGKYGLLEPKRAFEAVPLNKYETMCWLVPGVAFSDTGERLGRGKGIYDRFLAAVEGYTIGVFYDCQRCDGIPMEQHDQRLDCVITEKTLIMTK